MKYVECKWRICGDLKVTAVGIRNHSIFKQMKLQEILTLLRKISLTSLLWIKISSPSTLTYKAALNEELCDKHKLRRPGFQIRQLISVFLIKLRDVSGTHGERVHQDMSVMESKYQGC